MIIVLIFMLLVADLINEDLLLRERLPEKKLCLTVILFTPAVRVPFPLLSNFTNGRESGLVIPALRDRFYAYHYQHRINDFASSKITSIANALASEHSTRCSRAVFHAPQVSNLLLSAEFMYAGYYNLTELQAVPNFQLSDDDRMRRYRLRNEMASHNEANLYTVPCKMRNAASYVRYLNRKAIENDSELLEDLQNGSNIMDLFQFYWSTGQKLPRWVKIRDLLLCYNGVVKEMIKGFEYQLAASILQDLQRRLRELTNPKYNVIFHVTDYEELFSINKFLRLFPDTFNLIPAYAIEIKIFESGRVVVLRHYVGLETQMRHTERIKVSSLEELQAQLSNAIGSSQSSSSTH